MPIAARLDEFGKPAWIILMILSFIWWWPLGLAMLAFLIGSGRMGCWNHNGSSRWQNKVDRMQDKMDRMRGFSGCRDWWGGSSSSGNRAFDDYSGCASPRTARSSISSWPNGAIARRKRHPRIRLRRHRAEPGTRSPLRPRFRHRAAPLGSRGAAFAYPALCASALVRQRRRAARRH